MAEPKWMDQYRKWVLSRTTEEYPITQNESGNLEIEFNEGFGMVNFYELEMNIIELRVMTIPDDDCAFFLHFEMADEEDYLHAQELFYDMEKSMRNLKKNKTYHILLTCTSALTTSYFADLLNNAAEANALKYKFRAVSYDQIDEEGKNEDVILLAPQVHHERKKFQEYFPNKIIINIPATIFGKYNAGELIDIVKEEIKDQEKKANPRRQRLQNYYETNKKILTVGYTYDKDNGKDMRIIYRYYKDGQIECSSEKSAENVNAEDIVAVVEEMVQKYPEINVVGLSIPGAIEEGVVKLEGQPIHNQNIVQQVKDKCHKLTFAFNDANMIVTGLYWLETGYKSILCYYLPYHASIGEVGVIVNGHMIRGRKHVAGEMRFLQKVLNLEHSAEELANTEEGNLELISKSLISMISTVGPQAIYVYSYKLKDMEKLKIEMAKTIDEEYIPDLVPLEDVDEYMLTGTFLRCIWITGDMDREKIGRNYNPFK